MEKHNIWIKAVWLLCSMVGGLLSTSCSEEYLTYDTDYSGIYFSDDTLRYSFGVTPTNIREKEYMIPVCLMGEPSSDDRTFSYKIDKEKTTAEEGVQFSIGQPVIQADSVRGYIPVRIYRDALAGDYQNGFVRYRLDIRLSNNSTFVPTLNNKDQVCVLFFDNAVEQPEWLDYKGDKVWHEYEFGVWHPLKLIKMVECFHALQDVLPESYAKMVAVYGENLEHVQYGDFFQFRTIVNKYIKYPVYEYFADPANREEILSLYPDFPFDFPNPY
ncbi:MAG: DUF4843 domain-containing protein [Bacteroidaceae bacterium]|nr:DUF4843 domain-containing protein [Bacteroidaceae bacterium]